MTGYVIRHVGSMDFWTGQDWSPLPQDARVFEFSTIADRIADRDSGTKPGSYHVVPVFVEDGSAFGAIA